MISKSHGLLQGALEMLVLKTLVSEDRHGWGVAKRLKQISSGTFQINVGSLYPALYRLERKELVESYAGVSDKGRGVRIYRLLPAGRAQLEGEVSTWTDFAAAVSAVLQSDN